MSSDGCTIYSYGTHFPMATIYRKEGVVLLNNSCYSVTTTQHQNAVRRAIDRNAVNVIEVPTGLCGRGPNISGVLAYLTKKLVEHELRVWDSRTRPQLYGLNSLLVDLFFFVKAFRVKKKNMTRQERIYVSWAEWYIQDEVGHGRGRWPNVGSYLSKKSLERPVKYAELADEDAVKRLVWKARDEKREEKREESGRRRSEAKQERYRKEAADRAKKKEERLAEWLSGVNIRLMNGDTPMIGGGLYGHETWLRVRESKSGGKFIETSLDVIVRADENVKKLFELFRGIVAAWEFDTEKPAEPIQEMVVPSMSGQVYGGLEVIQGRMLHAGCHYIPYEQAEAVALKLGWTDESRLLGKVGRKNEESHEQGTGENEPVEAI